MNRSKFSISALLVFVAAFASGFSVASWAEGGVYEFCMGALTVFIGIGLIQQVISPAESGVENRLASNTRRLCLIFILGCLCIAIFRAHSPYVVPTPNDLGEPQEETVPSSVAQPLWVLSLVLGSLTARLRSSRQSLFSSNRFCGSTLKLLFLTGFLVYLSYLAYHWAIIPALVDIAIQGLQIGLQQGPAVGTSDFVQWFGRNPTDFQQFVRRQILSWPLLVLALFTTVAASQANTEKKSRLTSLLLVVALASPSVLNAFWLFNGAAYRLFPEFIDSYWDKPRPELPMIMPPLLLIVVYLTTRRVQPLNSQESHMRRQYWCDSSIIGWLFVVMGSFGSVSVYRELQGADPFRQAFEDMTWLEFVQSIPLVMSDVFAYPEYAYPCFLIPYGAGWLWRRRKISNFDAVRWPQFGRNQLLYFPLVLLTLCGCIVLSIPFGLALYHVGL